MDLIRAHRHLPDLVSRATDIGEGWHSAGSTEIPAHVRCPWRQHDGTEVVEIVWGMVTAWTSLAMHVELWRHGEHHVWVRREDVEPRT
ncbi:hypothetical protein SAMN06264364_14916 [Quadrisphaera granulorum]|uniref:Uncharacterized protein n=1 Tax=Quadrisphaera granulorum TaxID=317664 RepID=A0A315ZMR6_9ACTN|nr:hypothetical protein [Quadrisphaera granulorum]PWJ46280.1 hypothetical protein BXY45_14916 [Quadrisphaera granulorum]SZE99095.1 hypothetical protein SAMN06264364_14916 [Quadrisphaera granulorum]